MNSDVLVKVEGVRKKFCRSLKRSLWYGMKDMTAELLGGSSAHDTLRPGEFWAVDDVSFELRRGECLGLIGRNGAGKTTLLKMLNGLIKPDAGRIEMHGRIGALIALGAGFNPILTGRENIYVKGSILGLTKREIDKRMDEIIDFAEIREFIDSPVQSYSSGMQVRLGFAVSTALEPDVLLLDEVLAVGDAAFRAKCYRRVSALRKRAAVIFVSHHMEFLSRICDRCLLLSHGVEVWEGNIETGIQRYEQLNNESNMQDDGSFLSMHEPIIYFSVIIEERELSTGSPLTLRVRVTSLKALDRFLFRMVLYNSLSSFAADCNVFSTTHGIAIDEGTSVWCIRISSIPLKNGRYSIGFNVIDSKGDSIVWSYKLHNIRVTNAYAGANSDCQLEVESWRVESSQSSIVESNQ